MNILSLFDWISCGRIALERAWIQVDKYFASEIDKYAIQISRKNYPNTIHIGSITDVQYRQWWLEWNIKDDEPYRENTTIDMIIWGSPCQDLSIAKKDGKWLQWEKSSLFFEYVRLLKKVKPKYFLLENVASMKKADKEEITRILTEIYSDTQCYLINSALVSAQNRKRLYWTNIQGIEQPEDKGIILKDILESWEATREMTSYWKSHSLTASYNWAVAWNSIEKRQRTMIFVWCLNNKDIAWDWKLLSRNCPQGNRVYSIEWKSCTLSALWWWMGAKTWLYECEWKYRKLTSIECERLQTLPDNYTEWISNTQRYKAIGNWWTVDVIAHIFSYLK